MESIPCATAAPVTANRTAQTHASTTAAAAIKLGAIAAAIESFTKPGKQLAEAQSSRNNRENQKGSSDHRSVEAQHI